MTLAEWSRGGEGGLIHYRRQIKMTAIKSISGGGRRRMVKASQKKRKKGIIIITRRINDNSIQ